jgi:cytochrome c oxidase subunit 2
MPHFRAQMNCVPGMVTQFVFVPSVTTADMRLDEKMALKVIKINKIRAEKSLKLVAEGKEALEPYAFDYLLLCNKICGASHYNMQMKIVVDTPEDFKKWLAEKPTVTEVWKQANSNPASESIKEIGQDTTLVVAQVIK